MPLSGLSSTYQLGNGGGKSVLLMLIMQCIIPNYTLNADKPFKLMFKGGDSNRTTHVLIEWELDSELSSHKTLLTGFCAKKRSSSDEDDIIDGVEYFNYTHLYDSNNDMDILRIPLCHTDGNTFVTMSLSETRKMLRDKSDEYDIWIGKMNGKREYQQHIKKYCILGAEGKLIGSINESENQLRSHFKKSYGTSRTVIEKLLLNTTIECLNDKRMISGQEQDETNSELLADTLIQSQKDIKRLNDELERMQETHAYHAEILKLTDANTRLVNAHTEFEDTKHQTAVQCTAHRSAVVDKQNIIQDIEAKLIDATEQRDAVEIDIDRLKVMRQNAILNKSTANVTYLDAEKERIETTLKDTEHKSKLAIATNNFLDIQAYETEIHEYQSTIDNISKDNEELFGKFNTYGKTLHLVLSEELAVVQTQYKNAKLEKEKLGNESEDLQKKIGGIDQDIKSTNAKLGELNIEIDKVRSTESELTSKCQKYPQLNSGLMIPEDELDATHAHLKTLNDTQTTLNKVIDGLRTSIAEDGIEKSKFNEKVSHTSDKIKQMDDDISKFEAQQSIAMGIVNVRKSTDICTCLDELNTEIESTFESRSSSKRDLDELRRELRTVEMYGFVLPEDFENALTWFNDKYGFAQSGAEYLKDLSIDEQKEKLEHAPWLPKAIILTDDNFNQILANPIGKLTNAIMDSSVILISLLSLQKNEMIPIGDVFIPSRNTEHYISILDRDNTIERINADIQKVNHEIEKYDGSLAVATRDRDTLKGFVDQYPEGHESELHSQRTQCQTELDTYTTTLSEISARIEDNEKTLEQTRTELSNVNNDLDTFSRKLTTLTELIQAIGIISELQKDIDENTTRLNKLSESLTSVNNENDRLKVTITEKEESIESLSAQKNDLESYINEELSQFKTMDIETLDERDTSVLRAEYESTKKIIDKVSGNVSQLQDKIQKNRGFIDKLHNEITRNNITIEQIKANGRNHPFSEEYIRNLGTQIKTIQDKLITAGKKLANAREKQVLIEDKFNSMVQKYNVRVPEAYVPDQGLMDENQFRADIEIKQTELARLRGKIAEIEALHDTSSKELNKIEFNLRNYEILCTQYHITTAIIDTHVELKDHDELMQTLTNRHSNVERNKDGFRRTKDKVMNNIANIDTSEYFKTPIRDKLHVADTLEDARFNANALEKYSDILLKRMEDQQEQIDALKKVEENVVDLVLEIAKMYKDHIKKFPLLSRIKFKDETHDMIRINFKKCEYPDEQAEKEMRIYIRDLIRDIEDNKIDKTKLVDCLTPALLLNKVLDMKAIQMEMRKIDKNGIQRFLRWEQIEASDGQTNAIFIVFLVVLISYIRDIVIDRRDINTSKMMIIDNPFGSTSGAYLWEVIASILEQNNVQLICPTHNIKADILKFFPINFTLTTEPSASGRTRIGVKVKAKDETLDTIKRQQQYGQITLDV
jgi:chromosome segregation ATPase